MVRSMAERRSAFSRKFLDACSRRIEIEMSDFARRVGHQNPISTNLSLSFAARGMKLLLLG